MSEPLNCGECGKPCRKVGPWLCECGSEWFDKDACAAADRMVAAYKAAMNTVRAERRAAESRAADLASRVSALEGALQECIEREYYDGQMDPARAALSAPAPCDCGTGTGVHSPRCAAFDAPAPGDATPTKTPEDRRDD